ncbi:hypothetical protein DL95DRAFT_429343 [Leptodontidium sp. 2 PMI_412]|nr:hypothetical protein DL95DRAFT_429343 [Leptodontidium sp. 2 PMI_412]
MVERIKSVILAGSTGALGSSILHALIGQDRFNVTVLVVDFDSITSLTESVKRQNALVDAIASPNDPTLPIRLIDAAVVASIYRIILVEFSLDPENTNARALPLFVGKSHAYEYIQKLGKENKITWTAVSNYAFLDYSLRIGFANIDFLNKKIKYLNDGTMEIPWTLLSSIGIAIANKVDMEKAIGEAMTDLKARNVNFKVIGDIIRYLISTSGYVTVPGNDNELLGVKVLTDGEVK